MEAAQAAELWQTLPTPLRLKIMRETVNERAARGLKTFSPSKHPVEWLSANWETVADWAGVA